MTDKEKLDKLVAEIERRIAFYNEQSVRKTTTDDISCALALQEVLWFYDSMQEEPVSNVWHDAQIDPPQAKKKILAINEYGACEVDYAINMALYWPKVIKWAYTDDLVNL